MHATKVSNCNIRLNLLTCIVSLQAYDLYCHKYTRGLSVRPGALGQDGEIQVLGAINRTVE